MVPVCGSPGGWYSYMKSQIRPRATDEIAIGMKISDLTNCSYLTRSNRTASISPKINVKIV